MRRGAVRIPALFVRRTIEDSLVGGVICGHVLADSSDGTFIISAGMAGYSKVQLDTHKGVQIFDRFAPVDVYDFSSGSTCPYCQKTQPAGIAHASVLEGGANELEIRGSKHARQDGMVEIDSLTKTAHGLWAARGRLLVGPLRAVSTSILDSHYGKGHWARCLGW